MLIFDAIQHVSFCGGLTHRVPVDGQDSRMPRYFFNVIDELGIDDDTGLVLEDDDQARLMAVRTSGEMLRDLRPRQQLPSEWEMRVTEESGRTVAKLRFSVLEA